MRLHQKVPLQHLVLQRPAAPSPALWSGACHYIALARLSMPQRTELGTPRQATSPAQERSHSLHHIERQDAKHIRRAGAYVYSSILACLH